MRRSRRGLAAADAGADLIELGIPFSDPLADGPVIHAAATAALAAGATPHGVLGVCEGLAERLPVVLMVYANVVLTAGPEAFALRAASAGAAGLIVPDLPHDEAGEVRAACDAEGLALVPLVAPTTTPERVARDRGGRARLRLHGVAHRHHRRARRAAAGPRGHGRPACGPRPSCRWRWASASPRREQARAVAEIADGVIVGSRVVRAAGEGGAEAVGRELVAEARGSVVRRA